MICIHINSNLIKKYLQYIKYKLFTQEVKTSIDYKNVTWEY